MKLNLRSVKSSDKKYFVKWWNDPYLQSMTSGRREKPADVARFFPKLLKVKYPNFIILANGKPIGHIMLKPKSKTVFRTPIVIFGKKYRGKGIGAWALRKILQMGFGEFRYQKAYLEVRPENRIAYGVYKKLGFKKTGIKTYRNNKYLPKTIEMELAKNNWKKKILQNREYPKINFYLNQSMDLKNAIGFVEHCITSGRKDHARMFLPDQIEHILDSKYSKKDRAKIIAEFTRKYYSDNKKSLQKGFAHMLLGWKRVEKRFFSLTNNLFKYHPWPKGNYRGFGTIFLMYPRIIDQKVFYFPLATHIPSSIRIKIIAHEMLHFMFFDYVLKNYGLKEGDKDIWAISEAFNSVIEGWGPYQTISHGKSKPYKEVKKIYAKMKQLWKQKQDIDWLIDKIF